MEFLGALVPTPLQQIWSPDLDIAGVKVFVKRDDLIHPIVSGNKWRKLKYNLLEAQAQGHDTIVTFGGSFSNHLYALAAAGKMLGIKTVAIVRGEEFGGHETTTLRFCREQGMELRFVSREEYRQRHSITYLNALIQKTGRAFIVPEGGTSSLALKGVAELVAEVNEQLPARPDFYTVSAGTGGTAAGILSTGANVIAFSSLKGGAFLKQDIDNLLAGNVNQGNLTLATDYHFGGYAKWNSSLLDFIKNFRTDFDIQLEQVYTGKMLFGLLDMIQKKHFERGTVIVAVHTGGLQGLLKEQ